MLIFNYLLDLLVNKFIAIGATTVGIVAIIVTAIKAVPKCFSSYFDYRKTVHTNDTQVKLERMRLKGEKSEKTDVPTMRIDRDSS